MNELKCSIIACQDSEGAVADCDRLGLPWGRIPAELRHFRQTTQGGVLLMGARTWLSLPDVLKLKGFAGRRGIVMCSGDPKRLVPELDLQACSLLFDSDLPRPIDRLEWVMDAFKGFRVWLIGGPTTWREFLTAGLVERVVMSTLQKASQIPEERAIMFPWDLISVGNGPVGNGPVGNGPVGNGPVGNRKWHRMERFITPQQLKEGSQRLENKEFTVADYYYQ